MARAPVRRTPLLVVTSHLAVIVLLSVFYKADGLTPAEFQTALGIATPMLAATVAVHPDFGSFEIQSLALGALPASLARTVALRGVRPIAAGILAGMLASFALARVIHSLLFATSATDPVSLAASALVLGAFAFLGCYWPARRAALADPLQILREE